MVNFKRQRMIHYLWHRWVNETYTHQFDRRSSLRQKVDKLYIVPGFWGEPEMDRYFQIEYDPIYLLHYH